MKKTILKKSERLIGGLENHDCIAKNMNGKVRCLAVLTALALTVGLSGIDVQAEGIITGQSPIPGEYESIDRTVEGDSTEEGLDLPYNNNDGGNYIIRNGGTINVIKNKSTAYGIWVAEGYNAATNLDVGGKLSVKVDNQAYSRVASALGIWKYGGYNATGDESPENQGGTITIQDAEVSVINNKGETIGLLGGSDFGNNSEDGGRIVVNGNLNLDVRSLDIGTGTMRKTLGAAATEGRIEFNGDQSVLNVTAEKSSGNNNYEIAGLYTSMGGTITSAENSKVTLNVKSLNSGKIYGISSGFYDQVYTNYKGKSGVDLQGTTVINLNTKGTAIGIHSSYQAHTEANKVFIDFLEDSGIETENCIGLRTEQGGIIDVNSLYVGTKEGTVQDPNRIKALYTSNSKDAITVNKEGTDEVQMRGQVYAGGGTIDINLTGGTSYLYGNTNIVAGTLDLLVKNDAKWINVQSSDKSSTVTNLTLTDGGLMDMTDTNYTDTNKYAFQNIYIKGNMDGKGGKILMDIDASGNENNSDRLYVEGTHAGTHYINLNNVGENTDGAEGTVLVSVNDEQGVFKADDKEGTLYWNKYDLASKDSMTDGYQTDWYLDKIETVDPGEKPTTSVEGTLSSNSINYFMWRDSDKLMRRMGDLRHNGEEETGVWFRMKGSEIGYSGGNFGFKNKYLLYQLGYDSLDVKNEELTRYNGIAFSYTDGDSTYSRGSGDHKSYDLSLYRTELREKGHYIDWVLKFSHMDNKFHMFDTNGNSVSGKQENFGISASVEYGRKKKLDDNGWYVEPQGQLTFGRLLGDRYKLTNGVEVDPDGISSLVGRAGFNLGRDINERTNVYVKLNVFHEFFGDYDLKLLDSATGDQLRYEGSFDDTWLEYGIGAAIQMNESTHLYFDFERSAGGDFRKNWAWNAGVRWNF